MTDVATSTSNFQLLSATYESPDNAAFSHTQELPAPKTSATSDRVTYLATLRSATAELQVVINKELSQRMEEDKLRVAGGLQDKKSGGIDESKEEENYGEEVAEED